MIILLVIMILIPLAPHSTLANNNIPIVIDVVTVLSDVSPVQVNDHLFVPVRAVSESLGAEVVWLGKEILIHKAGNVYKLSLGSKTIYKNGVVDKETDATPFIQNNRTMVTLDFISEVFNYVQVKYHDGKVIINRAEVSKDNKARYFDLALKKRFDHLPEMNSKSPPDLVNLQFFTYFSRESFWNYDEISTAEVDQVAKDHFGVTDLQHQSNKEWRLEGDKYYATGWSYSSACFYDLREIHTYNEGSSNITEVLLDKYIFDEGRFDYINFTFQPEIEYSDATIYVLNQKGEEMKKGLSMIDAIKSLIVEGDISHFTRSSSLWIRYYIDEKTGEMVYTYVKTKSYN